MLLKPTPRKNNVIKRPAFISFLKNDRFSGYKKLAVILAALWGFLAFVTGSLFQVISILLLIASVIAVILIPNIAKKHEKDQFVVEYQFGIHDVTESLQKKIPWNHVVCFINSYSKVKKTNAYESTFYIITINDFIKLDKTTYTEEQLMQIYSLLAPYLNQYQRYVAGENIVSVEVRDINAIRQNFLTRYQYLK